MSVAEWHGRIGSGGWGEVHRVILVENGPTVAVKLLLRHPTGYEMALRRFRREVRMHTTIRHPNVVPIIEAGLDDDPPWYAMPLADRDLAAAIADSAGDEAFIAQVFRQVLHGVQAAHAAGVIHRDLKPHNVLELGKGVWAVSDFGAGLELSRETTVITRSGGVGTLDYIAPEQYSDPHEAGIRSDVFSLGKLLLHMVTGQQPDPFRPRRIPGGTFGPIIDKATQVDPAHRYQSVDELIQAFESATTPSEWEPPTAQIERLREELGEPDASDATVDEVVALLAKYPDRADFHQRLVPRISMPLLESLRERAEDSFRALLERYDNHVSGGLEFSYCDTVADFYRALSDTFDDIDLFRMLFTRLLDMGASHNRWHVMGVVFGICRTASGDRVPVIRDAIAADAWSSQRTFDGYDVVDLAPEIQEALAHVGVSS